MVDSDDSVEKSKDFGGKLVISIFLALLAVGITLYSLIELSKGRPWSALTAFGFALVVFGGCFSPVNFLWLALPGALPLRMRGKTEALDCMKMRTPLEVAVGKLVSTVQAEWINDVQGAPAGLGPEGERVLDNAMRLLQAVKNRSADSLLGNATVHGFLGSSWLDCHSKAYDQADVVQNLLRAEHAT